MQRPPVGVKMVIESVCIMKGIKPKKVAGEKVLYLLLVQQSEETKTMSNLARPGRTRVINIIIIIFSARRKGR